MGLWAVAMVLEIDQEQVRVLKRALEARVRDMQLRLGGEPGDDGFRRELRISTQLLRQVEAIERTSLNRRMMTSEPDEPYVLVSTPAGLCVFSCNRERRRTHTERRDETYREAAKYA